MLSNDEELKYNLINALDNRDDRAVIGIFKAGKMVGLFSFFIPGDEKYLEMLVGLSRSKAAYTVMLDHLENSFPGYKADFVFNPGNHLLHSVLKQRAAAFEPEQQKMVYNGTPVDADLSGIEPLSEPHITEYLDMHNTDVYWTGEKVIKAPEKFRTLVAVEDGHVAAYIDVTIGYEENEPFDLLVREEYRRKGYGRKLLSAALEMNRPKGMTLLVDVDNAPAIRLYESSGFEKVEHQNSLVAHLQL